jgi:hypothetical protein
MGKKRLDDKKKKKDGRAQLGALAPSIQMDLPQQKHNHNAA